MDHIGRPLRRSLGYLLYRTILLLTAITVTTVYSVVVIISTIPNPAQNSPLRA